MGAQTNEARHPTTEGPSKALLAGDISQKAQDAVAAALGGGSAHDTGLDDVDGAADRRGDKPCHEGRSKVRRQVIGHTEVLDTQALECIVRG